MDLRVVENESAFVRAGADFIVDTLRRKPDPTVVLATGNSPIGVYRELAERYRGGEWDPSRLRVFQLDAYLGLSPDDRRSLYRWLDEAFLQPLDIPPDNVVRLPGDTQDPEAVCRAYDRALEAAGGFDLAVLGLGPNGHLGFNEPPSEASSPTRVVELTEASIVSNAVYWGGRDSVPRLALTAGMAALLGARTTLLLVSGAHKRKVLERTIRGPVTPEVPASLLQSVAGVTVLADRAAWPVEGAEE